MLADAEGELPGVTVGTPAQGTASAGTSSPPLRKEVPVRITGDFA